MMLNGCSKWRLMIVLIVASLALATGCASKKTAPGRDFQVEVTTNPEIGRQAAGKPAAPVETGKGTSGALVGASEEESGKAPDSKGLREGASEADEQRSDRVPRKRPSAGKDVGHEAPAQLTPPANEAEQDMMLNFEDAELIEVIRHISQVLGINYILDAPVKGKVTIHSAGKLSQSELWPIFYRLLEMNGLTAVKRGEYLHIVTSKNLTSLPLISEVGRDLEASESAGGVIIQIIPLNNISAEEITKLLTPFTSPEGKIMAQPGTNTLIAVDYRDSIEKILRMVDAFDADIFEQMDYRFFPLEHMDAKEMVEVLERIYKTHIDSHKESNTAFIPIQRINTVLLVSSTDDIFESVESLIGELDVPRKGMTPQIYVYPVENGQAGEIADLLNEVFRSQERVKGAEDGDEFGISGNPFAAETKRDRQAAAVEKSAGESAGAKGGQNASNQGTAPQKPAQEISESKTLRDEVKIVADEARNSLIIQAIPPDYRLIRELLEKIDVLPRQVLIKMTIAEVTLDDETELGVEWSYVKGEGNPSTSLLSASAGAGGFKYTIGEIDRWSSALTALASKNKVNILSSPTILASNSRDAEIDISTEVPVASSEYEYTSGENPVISTNIEYRDTGVMLSVTPHINEVGLVTMDIEQEVSEIADNIQVGDQTYPSFFKRRAQTTLSVKSGQAIVIGGLIKETKTDNTSGAPWLVSVPVLKYIFGKVKDSVSKTELIIFISPQVITSLADVDAIADEFKDQMKDIVNSEP